MDPAPAVTLTKLDASIDLVGGIDAFVGTDPVGKTYFLVKVGAPSAAHNLLAQATVGADSHVRLTLPSAATVTPLLDATTPSVDPQCTSTQASSVPKTFGSLTAGSVLQIGTKDLTYSGYLQLIPATQNGDVNFLEYVDQDVQVDADGVCPSPGSTRTDRTVQHLTLSKGWNVVRATTTSAAGDAYTHTYTRVPVSGDTLTWILKGGAQASAPK